jgi:hypothetical protein
VRLFADSTILTPPSARVDSFGLWCHAYSAISITFTSFRAAMSGPLSAPLRVPNREIELKMRLLCEVLRQTRLTHRSRGVK